jgi:hydrogenase expression/formation protein HypC
VCLAIPGEIVTIGNDELRTGRVRFGGVVKQVCLAYVPEAEPGDFVLVHAGFGISRVDRAAAAETLRYLAEADRVDRNAGDPEAQGAPTARHARGDGGRR